MSIAVTTDAFRAANELSGESLFDLRFFSISGGAARSSCGGFFDTEPLATTVDNLDLAFVVAGGNPFNETSKSLAGFLRRLDAHGVALGGISGGSVILAALGLMKDRRFTVHWHHYDMLREISDDFLLEQNLFVIDRDRYSCAGGIGALDMVHAMLATQHSTKLAKKVSDWFIQTAAQPSHTPLRGFSESRYGIRNPLVLEATKLMDSHIADPLHVGQIAELCDISPRQLLRHFHSELQMTPQQFYRKMRLDKARNLIEQSAASIAEVASATGFQSPSHFSKQYRLTFGKTPKSYRTL